MENKNFHKFYDVGIKNRLFYESRLLMKDDPVPEEKEPAAEEAPKKSPKKKPKEDKDKKAEGIKKEARQEEEGLKGKIQRDKFKKDEKLPGKAAGKRGPEKEDERPKKESEALKDKEDLPKTPVKLPTEPKLKIKEEFLEKNFRDVETGLDRWSINVTRENSQINWQNWDHSTVEGLQRIYQDCQDLGIINQDKPFYDTMFAVLRNSADKNVNTNLADTDIRNAFLKPADLSNRSKIAALAPGGKFPGGEAFLKSFDHLQYLKSRLLLVQDTFQKDTLAKQRQAGEDPAAGKVTDFVRSNVATFQKAIRERDYATAGVYALGIYALYQTVGKKIFGGDGHGGGDAAHKGFDFKKWLLIGAAVYCGNKFAKNAGYDILKMTGFKTGDAEVAGTPMEVLSNILHKSEFSEQTKDLDYGIVLTMSETSLTTLEDLRKQSNKNGIDFIHPREFPALFPDIKNAWPFKMGLGEEGLKDYIGMSNTKLGPKEKEYIRVGQQIYKLSLAMQATYDETLHQHNKKYQSKTYQEALNDPILKNSKVRHLMEATSDYTARDAGGLFSGKKLQEVEAKLREGTDKLLENNGFTLGSELGSGHFEGRLKGFPIVVVVAGDGYRVYLRNDYGKVYNKVPGRNSVLIPAQGTGMEKGAKDAVKMVEDRMNKLVEPLQGVGGKQLKDLRYEGGNWVCKVELPNYKEHLDIDVTEVTALLTIDDFGDGVTVKTKGGAVINLKEENGKTFAVGEVLIPKLVNQKKFGVLRLLDGAGLLKVRDINGGKFTLRIGGNGPDVTFKYAPETKKYVLDPATQEADLIKPGSVLTKALREALGKNAEINQVFADWKKVLEETPEDYFVHFFKKVPNWFTKATPDHPFRGFKADQFSGSVAKNYTLALMETQKEFLLSKMENAVYGAQTLEDVGIRMDNIMAPALKDWQAQLINFSSLNTRNFKKGENFSEQAFQEGVLRGLAEVGIKSNEYKNWNQKFVDEIFTREGFDDLWDSNAAKARDIVKIFAHYTAPLDDPEIDGVDLNFKLTPSEDEKVKIIKDAERALKMKSGTAVNDSLILAHAVIIGAGKTPVVLFTTDDLRLKEKVEKKIEKKEKFLLYSDYADYVVEKIYFKINKGELRGGSIPGPGAWGIEQFNTWRQTPMQASHPEFVDREPSLKMSRNYISLDEYLLLTPVEKDKILATRRQDIILPRKNVDIKVYKNGDLNHHDKDEEIIFEVFGVKDVGELQKLLGKGTHDSLQITDKVRKMDIEQIFVDTFKGALNHLKGKYAGKIDENKFDAILKNYSLDCSVENFDKAPSNPTFKIMDYRYQSNSNLAEKVQELESRWSSPSVRFSRADQIIEIKRLVGEIIEREVLPRERGYIIYESLADKGVNAVKEFWAWIRH